jgi:hypothetical protein
MNTKQIDLANIVLMLVACAAAFVVPFELFLFSYAVLGPLHYLTEITWLKKRDYFTNGKRDYIFLVLPCVILTIITLIGFYKTKPVINEIYDSCIALFGEKFLNFSNVMIYLGFVSALAFVVFKDTLYKLLFVLMALFVGLVIRNTNLFFFLFAVFLPTLIHVFLFTGLFMLFGALKSKSKTGIISVMIFAACGISFFVLFPKFSFYQVSDYAQKTLVDSGFALVNQAFIHIFKLGETTRETIFSSNIGFGIMRFIAFAYTYHYLNWFSKTSIIKWHQVPKAWLAVVIILWLSAIALYAYDYKTGLIVLYFLSMLHVFLEFPLNYRSFIGIVEEIGVVTGLRKTVVAKKK